MTEQIHGKKKVLVCPLNWGLGHASRVIPIINELLKTGFQVAIGGDGEPMKFLQLEFPELSFICIPSKKITYSRGKSQIIRLLIQLPAAFFSVWKEHRLLRKIVPEHGFDAVISDNRYGLWNKEIKSVFITHQINILMPKNLHWLQSITNWINRWFIKKYDECWIPDFSGDTNLSGALSHPVHQALNVKYIGLCSRFRPIGESDSQSELYEVLVVLSGPEPQRSFLEEMCYIQLKELICKSLIVRGVSSPVTQLPATNTIEVVQMASSDELRKLILQSKLVICRSGYSTIMDMVRLRKRDVVMVPTPGQTEQEYLAKYMMEKGVFYSVDQMDLSIKNAMDAPKLVNNIDFPDSSSHLANVVQQLFDGV